MGFMDFVWLPLDLFNLMVSFVVTWFPLVSFGSPLDSSQGEATSMHLSAFNLFRTFLMLQKGHTQILFSISV